MGEAQRSLLLRADAGPTIGVGHVMRSLALAQAFRRRGGDVRFAIHEPPPSICDRLQNAGVEWIAVEGPHGLEHALEVTKPSAVALDGYGFGLEEQRAIRRHGAAAVVIDDNGEVGDYECDVVVNGNVFADETLYPRRASFTRLLLGPRYALLREEFSAFQHADRHSATSSVLLTFGGADGAHLSERVLDALRATPLDAEVTLLVGGANARRSAIESAARGLERVHVVHDAQDMPRLLSTTGLAVAAAGSTCLELAFMGVPAIVIVTAPNQDAVARKLDELGVASSLGQAENLSGAQIVGAVAQLLGDLARRSAMSSRGRALIDGRGADRVVAAIHEVVT